MRDQTRQYLLAMVMNRITALDTAAKDESLGEGDKMSLAHEREVAMRAYHEICEPKWDAARYTVAMYWTDDEANVVKHVTSTSAPAAAEEAVWAAFNDLGEDFTYDEAITAWEKGEIVVAGVFCGWITPVSYAAS